MADDEISEAGRQERFARWEQVGLDRVKHDLLHGGTQVVGGPPAVRELAWEWVRLKEAEQQIEVSTVPEIFPNLKLPTWYTEENRLAFEETRRRALQDPAIQALLSASGNTNNSGISFERSAVSNSGGSMPAAGALDDIRKKIDGAQMSSLADLSEIVGFFSYSREDDEASDGSLSALRVAIQGELRAQLGRSRTTFRLWQDQEAIAPGRLWESEIKAAVEQAVFFIPIVTPRAVNSHYCKFEFEAFLAREHALGRTDLVFPLLYIRVPALESEAEWRKDPLLSIIGLRQYVDWRPLRHQDVRTTSIREAIERFCGKIVEALRKLPTSPEERQETREDRSPTAL
jgi:TIR domain